MQYQIAQEYVMEFSYQGSSGVGLLERWNINTFPLTLAQGNLTEQNRINAQAQNFRPFSNFGDVRLRSNFGHSTYHGGTIKLEKRMSKGLFFNTFYTFAKAINSQDNDNDGSGVAPIENRRLEKARASYDRNHRWIGVANYELPFGAGKKFMNRGGAWNYIFGGYDVAWIQTYESGNPLTFSFANSPNNYYPTFAGNRRPDLVSRHYRHQCVCESRGLHAGQFGPQHPDRHAADLEPGVGFEGVRLERTRTHPGALGLSKRFEDV